MNSVLGNPCRSKEECDARYGALMALTFQSTYMPDGMEEYLAMLRGCSLVASRSLIQFQDSAFVLFSTEGYLQRVTEIMSRVDHGLPDQESIDDGLASLQALVPLCQSVLEHSFLKSLQIILKLSRTSCIAG